MNMHALTPVKFAYLENLAKKFILSAGQKQFVQENIFKNAVVRRIANAMNRNSEFTGSYTDKPFWYQEVDLRQITILTGGQPIVDFDAADTCRLYVTTMTAMNFRNDNPSFAVDYPKDHYIRVFHLTYLQNATRYCHYPAPVAEQLRVELNYSFPLKHITGLIVLVER